MRPRTWRACEPLGVRSSRSTRRRYRRRISSGKPKPRPCRRCGRAPTSSFRRPSSMGIGVGTPTSSIGRIARARSSVRTSYDIADTKLSRGVKAAAIIQMCVYADLLERLQGVKPETVYVVTGDGVEHPHRLDGLRGLLPPRKGALRGEGAGRFRAIEHVPRPGRSLPGLRLVSDLHPATARRRSPVDRGRHAACRHGATSSTAASRP